MTTNIGVVGVGFLGRGIVACMAAHGFRVVAYDNSEEALEAAETYVQRAMDELVANASFPPALTSSWRDNVEFTQDLTKLALVEFVIESVAEDIAVKNAVYDQLENTVAESVPIATNTSSLPVTLLAAERKSPQRFLGMHWAEPAYATYFMELIKGEQTSDAAFEAAYALAKRAGKQPAVVEKDVPAFIVNRIGYAMFREALHLLDTGVADAATIDRSFRNAVGLWANFAGPFRWIDLTGGPALYGRTMSNVFPTLCNETCIPESVRRLMCENAQGVTNHRGFFEYTEEEAKKWEERFRRSVWQVRRWSDELALEDV